MRELANDRTRLWVVHNVRDLIEKADMLSRNDQTGFRHALRWQEGLPPVVAKPLSTWEQMEFVWPHPTEWPTYQYFSQTYGYALGRELVRALGAAETAGSGAAATGGGCPLPHE